MIVLHFASILLGVAFAAVAGAAQADIKTQWVEYTYGGAQLKGYLAYDDAITGRRPGVLMVHRRDGMSALTLKNTEMYAKLGYVAFAPDIYGYGQGVLPKDIPEMQTLQAQYEKDRSVTLGRAQAGLHVLTSNPLVDASKVALVGYCMGGAIGIELAYAGASLVGVVAIHGSFLRQPPDKVKNVKGKVLILHGAEDVPVPIPAVNALIEDLRAAKVNFRYELYSGTGHGFSVPKNDDEERANIQSMISTERFLNEVLGAEAAAR